MSYYPYQPRRVRPVIPGPLRLSQVWAEGYAAPPAEELPYLPTVDEVGTLMRARTKTATGNELGTFDDTTRPTGDEVSELIIASARYLSGVAGLVPEVLNDWARHLCVLYTAVQIEEGYFPEQVGTDRSARDQYWERFQWELSQFIDAVGSYSPGGVVGGGMSVGTVFTPPADRWYGSGFVMPPIGWPGSRAYTRMTEELDTQPVWPPRIPPDGEPLPRA